MMDTKILNHITMNNTKIFLLFIVSVLFLSISSCDDTSENFQTTTPTPATLAEVSINTIKLDPNNVTNSALSLNWQSANYGQQAAINYAVEFSNDENFTNPIVATSVTGINAVTLSVSELNNAAGNAGLNPFEWANVYVRIVSSLGSQSGIKENSNSITLSVFPFFNYVFNDYYIVGDAASPGWDNNNNNPALFRDASDENLYKYTGYFGDGLFKVLETKGLWQPQWGTNDGTTIEVNPGGGDDPERFPSAGSPNVTPGFYTFTINFATKEFTFTSFDASGTTSPAAISVQGTSLNANTALSPLTFDGHIWFANAIRLKPGDFQFVTDTGDTWGSDTPFSGIATNGDTNIPVIVEDDYDVWFNDLTGEYILVPLNL